MVQLPPKPPCEHAIALKITGENLRGFRPEAVPALLYPVAANAQGVFTLGAEDAELRGDQIQVETQGKESNLGFWDKGTDWPAWKADITKPGRYRVSAHVATIHEGAAFLVLAAGQKLTAKPAPTGAWDKYATFDLGVIEVKEAGVLPVAIRATDPAKWQAINLRWLRLSPAN
jgi:hypothetical protein